MSIEIIGSKPDPKHVVELEKIVNQISWTFVTWVLVVWVMLAAGAYFLFLS